MKTPNPDGLEAWCVALAAWFINFLIGGLGRIPGVLFVPLMDMYNTDRREASIPFFARPLVRNLLGPLAGIIGQKYGVRAATIMGGIIGAISAALCFYTYDIWWITIMWGVFNGFGAALTVTLPQVILDQYFKKHKTTASGMAFSGQCVSAFVFPALAEYLFPVYDLGGTFLILAGISMNVIPAAMLLTKPSWVRTIKKKRIPVFKNCCIENRFINAENIPSGGEEKEFNRHFQKNDLSEIQTYYVRSGLTEAIFSKGIIETEFLRKNRNHVMKLLSKYFHCENNSTEMSTDTEISLNKLYRKLEDLYDYVDKIINNDNFFVIEAAECSECKNSFVRNKVNHHNKRMYLNEKIPALYKMGVSFENCEQWESFSSSFNELLKEEKSNILQNFSEDEHKTIFCILEQFYEIRNLLRDLECGKDFSLNLSVGVLSKENSERRAETDIKDNNTFSAHIKTAFRLHTNPLFLLISLNRSVHYLTFIPLCTIIVDFAMDKGVPEEDGKYIIGAFALGDLIGRQFLGWITDHKYLSLPRFMFIVTILHGACAFSFSFMNSKAILLLASILLGIFQGSLFIRHPVLITRYFGRKELTVAMGCINFFSGLLGFALPSYIGYFRDTVGAYDGMFYITGGIGVLTGLLWAFEPYFLKRMKSDKIAEERIPS